MVIPITPIAQWPGTCASRHAGAQCDCAACRHDDGVCIDHISGSGCAACDGPVHGCAPGLDDDE